MKDIKNLDERFKMKALFSIPEKLPPILIIGAGGIVNDAHLPAYGIAGFKVAGIYDIDLKKAKTTAERFSIPVVYDSLNEMLEKAPPGVIFDLALPGNVVLEVLQNLPNGAAVLIQKPMGENYEQAKQILKLARDKKFIAGVNFQLRYAPFIMAARKMINKGLIGELCDIEVNVNVYTPWHLWSFLYSAPRVEIPYHSIHYIDLIRSFLGNPSGIYAKTTKHPLMQELASVRSNIIMDYGELVRANILTNHCHQFGLHNQQSYIKFEGTKGAIKIKMGVLMNYPKGIPDVFEYVILQNDEPPQWKTMDIEGSWFPHAFIGSMTEVMKAADGDINSPDNSVEDCINTMACVEAAYESSNEGAIKLIFK
jgi:predicted dehydrogenase